MMRGAMLGLALLMTACGPKVETTTATDNLTVTDMNTAAPQGEEDDAAAAGADDAWQVQDAIDPITDARLIRAATRVVGQVNDIEVTAACNPGEPSVTYTVSGFDKKGEGARLDTNFTGASAFNRVIYRADARPAQTAMTLGPQYNNQTQIVGEQGFDAANASRLTLRLQFADANETYLVDQSSTGFQEAMRRCLEARAANAQLDQRRAAAAARAQEERAAAQGPATNPPENLIPDQGGNDD